MFLYASSAPAAYCVSVAWNCLCFSSSTVECVIYVFCNILVYSNGFLSWLVYLFYTDSCVIFAWVLGYLCFLWMRLSVRGEFTLHNEDEYNPFNNTLVLLFVHTYRRKDGQIE
jgi:hypothetical protein